MQTALFEPTQAMPRARRTDPNTSHEAAATARNFAAGHRALILETLKEHQRDGMTVHEIAAYCRLDAHAIGKRIGEMAKAGQVECVIVPNGDDLDGYTLLTRKSPAGVSARVWRACA
jgi:urease gamma subunit